MRSGLTIFKRCLNYDEDSDGDFENSESDVYYDRPLTREEVLLAIQRFKNGKAAGPDGIIGEFFKHAGHLAVDFLVKFFNVLFDRGIYPDSFYREHNCSPL